MVIYNQDNERTFYMKCVKAKLFFALVFVMMLISVDVKAEIMLATSMSEASEEIVDPNEEFKNSKSIFYFFKQLSNAFPHLVFFILYLSII